MSGRVFLACSPDGIRRAAEGPTGDWQVDTPLSGVRIHTLAADPLHPGRVYAGNGDNGILRSEDHGQTWQQAGLAGIPVRALASSSHAPGLLYAGCKPASLYVSQDAGDTWQELPGLRQRRRFWWFSPAEPPDWRPYVQAIALSPRDPGVLLAGIELGGVLRSADGGATWSTHRRGAVLDCHSLHFHPGGDWVYEGGGSGSGAAFSQDAGLSWQQSTRGRTSLYGWAVAADPAHPDTWYLSASAQPSLLRGEFVPPAHMDGQAQAAIYRCRDGGNWVRLTGGLPQPLDYMPYALLSDPHQPGLLYAGLSNGQVWETRDYGDHWQRLPLELGAIRRALLLLTT